MQLEGENQNTMSHGTDGNANTFRIAPMLIPTIGREKNVIHGVEGGKNNNNADNGVKNVYEQYVSEKYSADGNANMFRIAPILIPTIRRRKNVVHGIEGSKNSNNADNGVKNVYEQRREINKQENDAVINNDEKHDDVNNKDKGNLNSDGINKNDEKPPVTEETRNVNILVDNASREQNAPNITPYTPVAPMPIVRDDVAEKRKSDDTWKTILLVVFSILLIGAVVLGILYALGVFKKQDNDLAAKTDTDKANIQDDDVTINDDNNNLPSGDDGIYTNSNVDGQYDTGILQNSSINTTDWDGIGKSDGLLTNGDINYTNRFQEIVNCENSPNVTYTLWRDLNGDGVCQVNEIVAKGKGFMVDGNCAIINGRKFPLTDDMQAYSNLNKLSNQELKVLNHTSTYWKDGKPHIILDDLKTNVNIDSNNISGILNIEGYKIGDFSTSDISKNSFASDVVNSYLNNNNLTDAQKKLISAWSNGRSSANVKQIMDSYEMNNSEANSNLTDTHKEKDKNI